MINAGHCTTCEAQIWRGLILPRDPVWKPMWPDPTSVYAILETPEGLAVGLGYCAGCAPQIGDDGPLHAMVNGRPLGPTRVLALDLAPDRYRYWFSDRYGDWLLAWTRELAVDHRVPESTYAALREQWREDREAVTLHG